MITTFKCPTLGTYRGGVAEAIISFDEAQNRPIGIICEKYASGKCQCAVGAVKREITSRYTESPYNPDNEASRIRAELSQGIPKRELPNFESKIKSAIDARFNQELTERLNSPDLNCTITRGFQLVK
jgi:hypothetical protein